MSKEILRPREHENLDVEKVILCRKKGEVAVSGTVEKTLCGD